MSLIKKKVVTERDTASYKLERRTIELIRRYAEFIGSPQEHVVNQALRYLFRKDKEFKTWLQVNGDVSDESDLRTDPDSQVGLEGAAPRASKGGK